MGIVFGKKCVISLSENCLYVIIVVILLSVADMRRYICEISGT
jgi:hypothetical protein